MGWDSQRSPLEGNSESDCRLSFFFSFFFLVFSQVSRLSALKIKDETKKLSTKPPSFTFEQNISFQSVLAQMLNVSAIERIIIIFKRKKKKNTDVSYLGQKYTLFFCDQSRQTAV